MLSNILEYLTRATMSNNSNVHTKITMACQQEINREYLRNLNQTMIIVQRANVFAESMFEWAVKAWCWKAHNDDDACFRYSYLLPSSGDPGIYLFTFWGPIYPKPTREDLVPISWSEILSACNWDRLRASYIHVPNALRVAKLNATQEEYSRLRQLYLENFARDIPLSITVDDATRFHPTTIVAPMPNSVIAPCAEIPPSETILAETDESEQCNVNSLPEVREPTPSVKRKAKRKTSTAVPILALRNMKKQKMVESISAPLHNITNLKKKKKK